jgi:hypothetical protein
MGEYVFLLIITAFILIIIKFLILEIYLYYFLFRYLDISRHQAEDILRNDTVPNNTFLVRKQGKNEGHAISIK